MNYGQFNYHKIMFNLDIFTSGEEKEAYLTNLRDELDRVIEYFEKPKIFPLRDYADSNIELQDVCIEFCDFIKLMVDKYSPSFSDRRIPSNDQLQRLVDQEIAEYKKLKITVRYLLNSAAAMPKNKEQIPLSEIQTNEQSNQRMNKSHEIRTAIIPKCDSEPNDSKIVWHGSASSLLKLFFLMAKENLMKEVPVEKKLNFIDKFIVDKVGEKFQF